MIRRCEESDFEAVYEIINDAAQVYEGVIPRDRWRDPYMPRDELGHEVAAGVVFWGYEEGSELVGVMGLQDRSDVCLIRHAYVRTSRQRQGIGAALVAHLVKRTTLPILIGTWADASWATRFYEKHGFRLVSPQRKAALLRQYWTIPERQIETSVVLADARWFTRH